MPSVGGTWGNLFDQCRQGPFNKSEREEQKWRDCVFGLETIVSGIPSFILDQSEQVLTLRIFPIFPSAKIFIGSPSPFAVPIDVAIARATEAA